MKAARHGLTTTDRRLLIFATVSIALHLLLAGTAWLAPGLLRLVGGKSPPADTPLAAVEFVTEQQEGFGPPTAPDADEQKPQEAKPESPAEKSKEPPPPDDPAAEAAPVPPPPQSSAPSPAREMAAPVPAATARPTPKAQPAPQLNLGGTDSLSSLIARGSQIIPVEIDARSRNREPVYPREAVRLGQQGVVVLMVHVSPDGRAMEVVVERSSGHPLLDQAARDAVITWHFRPAVEGGVPVQSTFPVSIDFNLR